MNTIFSIILKYILISYILAQLELNPWNLRFQIYACILNKILLSFLN